MSIDMVKLICLDMGRVSNLVALCRSVEIACRIIELEW